MILKKWYFYILMITLVLFVSCLHSRTTGQTLTIHRSIEINSGNAILRITGQINENLYKYRSQEHLNDPARHHDNPLMPEGSRTKNETKNLSTGEVYRFSILPTEVVVINIRSLDGNDVEVVVHASGRKKMYNVSGSNRMGFNIAFQNR